MVATPRWHFLGIGGAGMSAVALLAHARGVQVSGSDAKDSPVCDVLREAGITVQIGADPAWLATCDTLVVSTAIRDAHPMLVAARARQVQVWHRSEALAWVAAGRRLIAVAGAHGKSTTSSLIAHVLTTCGLDPTVAVGATVSLPGAMGGARAGEGPWLVIEADESDRSFLNYHPEISVITNIEADHLDFYGSTQAFAAAFVEFAAQSATLVVCADDAGAAALAAARAGMQPVVTYGAAGQARLEGNRVSWRGVSVSLDMPLPGRHNLLNAAAAWVTAVLAGVEPHAGAAAIASFAGPGRRFELRAQVAGIEIRDDYAHHPTEVAALLDGARAHTDGRVLVLFQPHLVSRTKAFAGQFAAALERADAVVVTDIYLAREDPEAGVSGALITDLMAGGEFVADRLAAAHRVASLARAGDLVLTVGAGDVTELAQVIADDVRARETGRG